MKHFIIVLLMYCMYSGCTKDDIKITGNRDHDTTYLSIDSIWQFYWGFREEYTKMFYDSAGRLTRIRLGRYGRKKDREFIYDYAPSENRPVRIRTFGFIEDTTGLIFMDSIS